MVLIFCKASLFLSSYLPTFPGFQTVATSYTNGIQMVYALHCREMIEFLFVDRRRVAVVAQVIVLLPVRDDDHPRAERDDEALDDEDLEVVIARAGHPENLFRGHEAVIVGRHAKVEVERL